MKEQWDIAFPMKNIYIIRTQESENKLANLQQLMNRMLMEREQERRATTAYLTYMNEVQTYTSETTHAQLSEDTKIIARKLPELQASVRPLDDQRPNEGLQSIEVFLRDFDVATYGGLEREKAIQVIRLLKDAPTMEELEEKLLQENKGLRCENEEMQRELKALNGSVERVEEGVEVRMQENEE
ncbi:uncharacterized protein [Palaemon carinicauda]|uniref:uncharacterized protein n=1 Tax=Palaemon carinicauda TaxID=392227 RepID=UPI0035B61963